MDAKPRSANKTSGRYLIDLLESRANASDLDQRKYDMGFDVFIKHRSYAIVNKMFFWFAVLLGIFTAIWPIILVLPWFHQGIATVGAAVIQTMITGSAAFSALIYQTYKKRQVATENLLRLITFSDMPVSRLARTVMDEMARIDQGFAFLPRKQADDKDKETD
jgi:hypothetical protein